MDKRIIILIVVAIALSASFLVYRKVYYKHDGIRYAINPKMMIKTTDSITYEDQTADATRWKWDFGDGEFSSKQSGSHTYFQPGHYLVRVSSYGSFGMVTDSTRVVDVMPGDGYTAPTVTTAQAGINGNTEPNTGSANNYESSVAAASYEWSVEGDVTLSGRTQKGKVATYSFAKPGRRTLVLTMKNPDAVIRKDINVKENVGTVAGEHPLPPPPMVPASAAPAQAAPKPVVQHQAAPAKAPQQHPQQQPAKDKPKPKLKEIGEGVEY